MSTDCKESREWLDYHYGDEHSIGLRFYSEKNEPRRARDNFDPKLDRALLTHIRNCDECKSWVFTRVGPKILDRQNKLSQCCCPQMFGLLQEQSKKNQSLKFEFTRQYHPKAEGELWYMQLIYNNKSIGGRQVNFCFYCGQHIKTYEHT